MPRYDWLSIAGWALEVFTAVLSVVDVLSDVLVARQFRADGHMGWFWMVMASLFVSNCIYAAMFIGLILQDRFQRCKVTNGARFEYVRICAAFVAFFPVAQLFPLLQWALETSDKVWEGGSGFIFGRKLDTKKDDDAEGMGSRQDSWEGKATTAAAQEDLDADEEARKLVHRLQKSMEAHIKANVGFYVETVVEAIPQAVIQLIAVSALGEATPLQLLSMCLSLFSIVSKAYVVCVSYDLRAMLFKASLVAFDVFSLFYLFATLLARDEVVEDVVSVLVPGALGVTGDGTSDSWVPGMHWVELPVSSLSAWWIRKHLYLIGGAIVTMVGFAGFILYEEIVVRHRSLPKLHEMAFIVGVVAVILYPAALAIESVKFSLLLVPLLACLPNNKAMPFFALTFSFYRRGLKKGLVEGDHRLRHALHWVIEFSKKRSTEQTNQQSMGGGGRAGRAARMKNRQQADDWTSFLACALHKLVDEGRISLWTYKRPQPQNPNPVPAVRIPIRVALQQWFRTHWPNFVREVRAHPFKALFVAVAIVWGIHCVLFIIFSFAFNFAFPFLHVYWYGVRHLNLLQTCCLVFSALTLVLMIVLSPFMYRFITFTFLMKDVCNAFGWDVGPSSAQDATDLVAEYHKPPQVAILKSAVPVDVLPYDLTEVVADFVRVDHLDLSDLSAERCAELKDRM
jgi:hypothetical protein